MRTALQFGRTCLRHKPAYSLIPLVRYERHSILHTRWRFLRKPPHPLAKHTYLSVAALLSPAAFVALSEEDEKDGKTPEEHMLEASRAEIAKEIPEDVHGLRRAWKALLLGVDLYIIEPVATVLRFLHLVVIFVPVIGATPIIFFGPRNRRKHDERAGTLWWYSFLVHSMERAGPAFIKVC